MPSWPVPRPRHASAGSAPSLSPSSAAGRASSSRTRPGSWLSGVAVTTRAPNAPSRNSTSTTRLAGSTRSSWPPSIPVSPPACDQPVSLPGESAARCSMPVTDSSTARPPTSIRPRRSGCGCWRSRCTAARTSSTGSSSAALPTSSRNRPVIASPSGPAAVNQTAIAEIRPRASTARPAPSRRCAGSRSRAVAALRPTARASVPTATPSARQSWARACPMTVRAGRRRGCRAAGRDAGRALERGRRAGAEPPDRVRPGPDAFFDAGCRVLVPGVAAT